MAIRDWFVTPTPETPAVIPAPIVNVPAPIVNVPAPIVHVPAPIVNIEAPAPVVVYRDGPAVADRTGRGCGDCAYFHLDTCRRWPPVEYRHPQTNQIISVFPRVDLDTWCGEWR
jgi:hypothetical protein